MNGHPLSNRIVHRYPELTKATSIPRSRPISRKGYTEYWKYLYKDQKSVKLSCSFKSHFSWSMYSLYIVSLDYDSVAKEENRTRYRT